MNNTPYEENNLPLSRNVVPTESQTIFPEENTNATTTRHDYASNETRSYNPMQEMKTHDYMLPTQQPSTSMMLQMPSTSGQTVTTSSGAPTLNQSFSGFVPYGTTLTNASSVSRGMDNAQSNGARHHIRTPTMASATQPSSGGNQQLYGTSETLMPMHSSTTGQLPNNQSAAKISSFLSGQQQLPSFRSHSSLVHQSSSMIPGFGLSMGSNVRNTSPSGHENELMGGNAGHSKSATGITVAHQALPLQHMPHQSTPNMRPHNRLPQLSSSDSHGQPGGQIGMNYPETSSSGIQQSSVPRASTPGNCLPASSGMNYTTTATLGANPAAMRPRELKVEDALLYLDQVKQQFGNQPDTYNQFLEVMKSFKSQTIDTPGVIQRVSTLFHGYPKLILGFNTFLPPGYKIRSDSTLVYPSGFEARIGQYGGNMSTLSSSISSAPAPKPFSSEDIANVSHQEQTPKENSTSSYRTPSGNLSHIMSEVSATVKSEPGTGERLDSLAPREMPREYAGATSTPVEFDHAINYVTTIKQRFRDQPETYKAFLEILHTYQKEQRTIKEVLDQVSDLFRDHPDLLREFTFFLPDSVQEQAKDRLNRAADKAVLRNQHRYQSSTEPTDFEYGMRKDQTLKGASKRLQNLGPLASRHRRGTASQQPSSDELNDVNVDGGDYGYDRRRDSKDLLKNKQLYQKQQKMKRRSRTPTTFSTSINGLKGGDRNDRSIVTRSNTGNSLEERVLRREILAINDSTITNEEYEVFEKIRKILPSRDVWREFLKCLEVYSQDLLNYSEMIELVSDMFGRHTDVLDELKRLLAVYGHRADSSNAVWPYLPLAETDLSQSRRCTPSYRALPANYPLVSCTMRTTLENSICNDEWVSVPTGSEDFSFKLMRKNQYEEALFKCEDERFELDMILDANALTIYALEPLMHEIETLQQSNENSDELLYNYTLPKGLLKVVHCNAITRVYGETGNQILELLSKYPAGTIPVILGRLKTKQEEWKKVKYELNEKSWKEINEKNYYKSLDHSSFYFKQQDKKRICLKRLIEEAKEMNTKRLLKLKNTPKEGETPVTTEEEETSGLFVYSMENLIIHRDIYNLLSYVFEKNLSNKTEKDQLIAVYMKLWLPFFCLTEDWIHRQHHQRKKEEEEGEGSDSATSKENNNGGDLPSYILKEGTKSFNSILYGTESMYGFLRLYQLLYQRLNDAKELCIKAKYKRDVSMINPAMATFGSIRQEETRGEESDENNASKKDGIETEETEKDGNKDPYGELLHNDYYHTFISKLYAFLDGSIDSTRYEDYCRSIMGSRSYFLFTLDKVVHHMLKHLQAMASDEKIFEVCDLFRSYNTHLARIQEEKTSSKEDEEAEVIELNEERKTEYLTKADAIYEGDEDFYLLSYQGGILRAEKNEGEDAKEEKGLEINIPKMEEDKVWAPSPRVQTYIVNPWWEAPKLSMSYVGFLEDGEKYSRENEEIEEDMEDDGNSTSMSPAVLSPVSPMLDASDKSEGEFLEEEEEEIGENEERTEDEEIGENDRTEDEEIGENERTEDEESHSQIEEEEEENSVQEEEEEEEENSVQAEEEEEAEAEENEKKRKERENEDEEELVPHKLAKREEEEERTEENEEKTEE